MSEHDINLLLGFFKALANESRLKILGLLANQERSVEELAIHLGLKEPTVSHHLARLKSLGIVSMRVEKNTHFYRLELSALQSMSEGVFTAQGMASLGKRVGGEDAYGAKVRSTFIDEGRLVKIPGSRKKRQVILEWLATFFAEGRRYPEAEVNGIIKPIHEDVATLRRELVGAKLLARQDGVYWRP